MKNYNYNNYNYNNNNRDYGFKRNQVEELEEHEIYCLTPGEHETLVNKLKDAAEQMADLLESGYRLEVSMSRRGFQVYKMRKSRAEIKKYYKTPRKEQGGC